ncbi:MAG: biopolymer transporter ExbD [Pseudomonadota bacterium]
MARRRRGGSSSESEGDDVNLTPMLDVVFILLIFFIVTAKFISEPGVEITRLDVDNDSRVTPLAILVAIDDQGDIYIDDRLVEPNEVEFTLREMRKGNAKGELVLQADSKAPAGATVDFLELVRDLESITRVNVSTEQD